MTTESSEATLVVLGAHAPFRDALCDLLANTPDMLVVGRAAEPEEALSLASLFAPRLVIVDEFRLKGLPTICRSLALASPVSRIALLRSSLGPGRDPEAAIPGVFTISKDVRWDVLVEQISRIARLA